VWLRPEIPWRAQKSHIIIIIIIILCDYASEVGGGPELKAIKALAVDEVVDAKERVGKGVKRAVLYYVAV